MFMNSTAIQSTILSIGDGIGLGVKYNYGMNYFGSK